MIEVQVFKTSFSDYNLNTFQATISALIEDQKKEEGELSLVFCSDDYLLEINKKHLNHDYYTDIITFDYSEENKISGDLLISIDRVKENAKNFSVSFRQELNRVVIHGVLHLCGYKDKTEKEKNQMRNLENKYLKTIF
tara:strand:+ start:146 stop:559 length:414 start_codon:yes stop_codon:yes gene_type:complete